MTDDWALVRCTECDDNGRRADQPYCDHQAAYVAIARRGAEVARAAIRPPKLPRPSTGDRT